MTLNGRELNGLPPIESGVTADPEQDPVHRMSRLCVRIHMRSSIVFTARRVAQTAIRRYMKGAVDTGAALGAGVVVDTGAALVGAALVGAGVVVGTRY